MKILHSKGAVTFNGIYPPGVFFKGSEKNSLKFKGCQNFSDLFKGSQILPQPSYIKILLDFIKFLTGQIPLQSVPETTPRLLLVQGCLQS